MQQKSIGQNTNLINFLQKTLLFIMELNLKSLKQEIQKFSIQKKVFTKLECWQELRVIKGK